MSVKRTGLHQLREALINHCLDVMQNGETVINKEGNPVKVSPSASMLNVMRQLLKDNGIDTEPIEAKKKTVNELPFPEQPGPPEALPFPTGE